MSVISERVDALRALMKERQIDVYIIPTADFHGSEYVGEYFKARKFITGFSGSAGTAVITASEANLWTDARYFLQAGKQLEGSGIILRKMGEEGVPTLTEYVGKVLPQGGVIGFDGRVINAAAGDSYKKIADEHQGSLYTKEDLVDLVWKDRPQMSAEPAWILKDADAGESVASKFEQVRKVMTEQHADLHILSSLYDIAFLLNIRGNDIESVPVVLSYLIIGKETGTWYVNEKVLSDEVRTHLAENHINVKPYFAFYEDLSVIDKAQTVMWNRGVINYQMEASLSKGVTIVNIPDPSILMRAIKNPVLLDHIRNAHVKDAVAMIHFMYWLKTNIGKLPMTEISASDYLEGLRREQDGFIELSFDTISGYNAHGAIVHYSATPETDIPLEPHGLLLVDSGGHYMDGTTDITRTFALGPLTEDMKRDYTMVFRSHTALANTRFLYGCTGLNLDIVAREPFWENNMDFKHGTGHGVGYILNVHEGPNGFRWKQSPDRSEGAVLEEGMITTDEPGIYIEGKYGIRIENELICKKGVKNEYGQFMEFENITYVPIDLDAIEPALLSPIEKKHLNEYHAMVWEKMSPYFTGEELEFLKKYTREI